MLDGDGDMCRSLEQNSRAPVGHDVVALWSLAALPARLSLPPRRNLTDFSVAKSVVAVFVRVADLEAVERSHMDKCLYSRYLGDQTRHYWRPGRRLCKGCPRT